MQEKGQPNYTPPVKAGKVLIKALATAAVLCTFNNQAENTFCSL